ncbi:hypothetical protein MA16_Dca021294 [Dendrobium catenatum]|uniref:Uncharacterized protein n=1 Tax=Dendrobium catenatum TaxID=906689 RepID=A0A2I0XHF1_9ASPA|nr:hypothetical protein MA16_Dca021294 [Dendrobium catenatum]
MPNDATRTVATPMVLIHGKVGAGGDGTWMTVDGPIVVQELVVDDLHEGREDSIQVILDGIVKAKPDVEEGRSSDVDVSVDVEYESAINFGIRHSSLPAMKEH